MLIAHHIILTGYAHWLPNDPRGSMSLTTRTPEIAQFAENHFGRKKDQPSRRELKEFYTQVQPHLAHRVLWFNAAERQALAETFDVVVQREGLTCYACAVLPNHVHILIRKHRLKAEQMSTMLKQAGRQALGAMGSAPADHPVFNSDSCHIYKSDAEAMWNCIRYIERNYEKHGIPNERCAFVVPHDNWPNHKQ